MSYCSCSLDAQDGGSRAYFEHAETTRTVRDSSERAAAAAGSSSTSGFTVAALTGSGNTDVCMHRPDARRAAADQRQSNSETDKVQPAKVETTPAPEVGRLSSEGAENGRLEFAADTSRGASAALASLSDNEDCCQTRPDITSQTTQPEVVARRPVAAANSKSVRQGPTSERFDRVVQYFDSRQHISGKIDH